jgi:hypothetical protein
VSATWWATSTSVSGSDEGELAIAVAPDPIPPDGVMSDSVARDQRTCISRGASRSGDAALRQKQVRGRGHAAHLS